ncbi:hypothetical protein, partial [Phocaeicola coprocola]
TNLQLNPVSIYTKFWTVSAFLVFSLLHVKVRLTEILGDLEFFCLLDVKMVKQIVIGSRKVMVTSFEFTLVIKWVQY